MSLLSSFSLDFIWGLPSPVALQGVYPIYRYPLSWWYGSPFLGTPFLNGLYPDYTGPSTREEWIIRLDRDLDRLFMEPFVWRGYRLRTNSSFDYLHMQEGARFGEFLGPTLLGRVHEL